MSVNSLSRYRNLLALPIRTAVKQETLSLPIRRYPIGQTTATSSRHQFTDFDTADLLAIKYFSREDLYWYLLDANGGKLPEDLKLGDMLDIPSFSSATRVTRRGR